MGLVKYSAAVSAISGKVGGAVYARNKAGAVIRSWAKPVSAPTESQSLARANFGNQSAAWGALSPAERTDYSSAAATLTRTNRLGEPYVPSGRQIFVESATNLSQASIPPFATVPSDFTPPTVNVNQDVEFELAGGFLDTMNVIGNTADVTKKLVVFATRPIVTSKTNTKNDLRQIGVFTLAPTIDILTSYTALFGTTVVSGQQIQFSLKTLDVSNGMTSSPVLRPGIQI